VAQDDVSVRIEIERALGKARTAVMKRNAPGRICGLLTAHGRSVEWQKAFEHISEHFKAFIPGKPSHTRFAKKYCDEEKVKELIKRAAMNPSSVSFVRLRIGSAPIGEPGVNIVRFFAEVIGDRADLTCLVIFVDHHGALRTAYPANIGEI